MPDFKRITDFRRDNGPAIRVACARFIVQCRRFNLFTRAVVAVDGSKFKAVSNRDKDFTVAKGAKRAEQVEASIARYLAASVESDDRRIALDCRARDYGGEWEPIRDSISLEYTYPDFGGARD